MAPFDPDDLIHASPQTPVAPDDDDRATRTAGVTRSTGADAGPRSRRQSETAVIAPGTQIGRYVVVEVLGRGGMGVVLKAHDPHLDRNVALKRVRVRARDGVGATLARERLMREAQALAQLSHPNVVAVHDVGLLGDDVFVAMELVVGQTLRTWLLAHQGQVRRIVAVFLEAGAGLAAAHHAGLVHRDFKPDNVVVGEDGRARVLDFGLALSSDVGTARQERSVHDESPWSIEEAEQAPDTPEPGASRDRRLASSGRLTAHGSVIGTPRYMAPEQHRGASADGRADQFAFCVALYEALFDARPFVGDTLGELRDHVLAGDLIVPPPSTKVPARWRRAVLRGLASDPAARFPTMEALLAELRRDPSVTRRRALLVVAVVGLAGLALFGLLRPRAGGPDCRVQDRRVASAWNDETRQRLRTAFTATGRAYAADVLARTEPLLDRFVGDWQAMRIDACEATNVRGEQSTALLDQRIGCLDRKLDQMSHLITALGDHPSGDLVDRAVQAVTELGDVSGCSRREQLAGPAPRRLAAAAQATLDGVLQAIDRAELSDRTGAYADGLAIALAAIAQVRGLDAPDELASALRVRGVLEGRTGAYAAAETTLQEALRVAAAAGDRRLAAQAWLDLVAVSNEREERLERATAYVQAAEVAVGFLDPEDQPALHASLLHRRGMVHVKRSELDDGLRDLEDAVRATEVLYGDSDYRTGAVLSSLGLVLMKRGEYVRAEAVLGRSTAVYERTLGPGHPLLSTPLINLAGVLSYQRKHAEAEAVYRRALAIDEAALGPDHPYVADGMTNLGAALLAQGKFDDAQPYFEQALALQERVLGKDHPDVAWTLTGLSEILIARGQFDQGRTILARALAINIARSGADSEPVAQLRQHVAASYLAEGNSVDAYRLLAETLHLFERLLGPDHPRNALVLTDLAEAAVGLGRDAEVVRLGERALALMGRDEVAVAEGAQAWVRFLIARARHHLGVDPVTQTAQARAAAAAMGADVEGQRRHAVIEAWLTTHP